MNKIKKYIFKKSDLQGWESNLEGPWISGGTGVTKERHFTKSGREDERVGTLGYRATWCWERKRTKCA